MTPISIDDLCNDESLIKDCQAFYAPIAKLEDFGNWSNENTFKFLFGPEEGSRLWRCFVIDAKRNIYRLFFDFLIEEQQFIMAANILRIENLKFTTWKG